MLLVHCYSNLLLKQQTLINKQLNYSRFQQLNYKRFQVISFIAFRFIFMFSIFLVTLKVCNFVFFRKKQTNLALAWINALSIYLPIKIISPQLENECHTEQ